MDRSTQTKRLERALLKVDRLSATELARRIGERSPQAIAVALGVLVKSGVAVRHPGRTPTYTKKKVVA